MTVVDILEPVKLSKKYGLQAAAVILDPAKDFDVVDRKLLKKKLEIYGIRGTAQNWI